jgi:hypothetical protein
MQLIKRSFILITFVLLAACSTEKEIAKVPDPVPVYVPEPLITLELAEPVQKKKRGSVGANIHFTNSSSGTYQYILFRTTAYDEEGNIVSARKSRDHSAYLRVAGPIHPGEFSKGHSWKNTWSRAKIDCIDVDHVEIIFSDGSVEIAQGDRLTKLTSGSCVR